MDTSSSSLDHHLRKTHNGSQTWGKLTSATMNMSLTTVTSIGIGNHGSQIVNGRRELFPLCGSLTSGPALFSVVEELRLEELSHFVRDSVGRVIWQSGTYSHDSGLV